MSQFSLVADLSRLPLVCFPQTLTQFPSPPAVRTRPTAPKSGQMRVALRYLPQLTHSKLLRGAAHASSSHRVWLLLCFVMLCDLLIVTFSTPVGKKASKTEKGEVQIWVKDCKDLLPARGVIIDPFVKW